MTLTPSTARRSRILVDGGHLVAHTWDATPPDGSPHTGIDVVGEAATWSVAGERRSTLEAPTAAPVAREVLAAAFAPWTPMWNGDIHLVHAMLTPDFRIWFGAHRSADDTLVGPDAMAAYVGRFRAARPGIRFANHGELVADPDRARAAITWTVTIPGDPAVERGGIDLFAFRGDRIARVWSVTGTAPFTR